MHNINYFIYKVRHNDLLTDITKKFNISVEDLIKFHNNNCGDRIELQFNHTIGLKEILVPINYKTSKEIEQQLLSERPTKQLNSTFYKGKYNIKESIEKESKVELDYTISLRFREENQEQTLFITREQVNNKGKELSNKMQALALLSFQTLFPLSLLLDDKGSPTTINNYKLFEENFSSKRSKIEEFYKSDFVTSYLDLYQNKLLNKDYIDQRLSSFALFQVLFPKIEWFNKTKPFTTYFSILPNTKPILFSCESTYDHQDNNVVYTIIKGKSIEQKSLKDVIISEEITNTNSEDFVQAEIILIYVTDKVNKELQKCKLKITIIDNTTIYSNYEIIID